MTADGSDGYGLADALARALAAPGHRDYPLVDALVGRSPHFLALLAARGQVVDEAERLRAVARMDARQWRGDRELMRIAHQAADAYDMPIAAISLVNRDRQLLIARHGVDYWDTDRAGSFCTDAIRQPGEPLLVADAQADPRFAAKAAVVGPPFLRFYAGMPIVDRGGYPLGALCIADTAPHAGRPDLTALMIMAHEVERRLWA